MSDEKRKLRDEFRRIRDAILPEVRAVKSASVWKYVFELEEYKRAETLMLYSNIGSEVRTDVFLPKMLADGKRIALPVADDKEKIITPYEITDLSCLKTQTYGIKEPDLELIAKGEIKEVPKSEIDMVIVPGLGFDMFGNRLGYGGGFYDRFLKDYKGVKVGVAYTECLYYRLPEDENDIKVDMVITEIGCERFGQEI